MTNIIAIDLDGTLLDCDKNISQKNQEAIVKALDAGYQIYLCSGRPAVFVSKIKSLLDQRLNIIAFNGAYYENETEIKTYPLRNEDLIKLDALISEGTPCFFKTLDTVYFTQEDKRFFYKGMTKKQINNVEDLKFYEILKVVILMQNHHAQTLREFVQVYEYGNFGMELSCKEVDKTLHFQQNNYYAIGDGVNDLPLFKNAAYSFAMNNSDERLLEYADVTVENNTYEGVAKAIEMILALPY